MATPELPPPTTLPTTGAGDGGLMAAWLGLTVLALAAGVSVRILRRSR